MAYTVTGETPNRGGRARRLDRARHREGAQRRRALFHRRGGTVSLSKLGLDVKPYVEKFRDHANHLCRQLDRPKQAMQAQHRDQAKTSGLAPF
jgi:hypothetical protein